MAKFNSYIGKSYVQHATGYEDGVEPLRAELQANAESNNVIEILRVVGDKNYAALHSLWTIGTQQILYVDIWRVENGKLVEHWDQFQNVVASTLHNNTMYTGPDSNPLAIQDKEQNRQKAIDEYGYGPLNPSMPNLKFWIKKAEEWNLDTIDEAKQSLCGNCAAFDIKEKNKTRYEKKF